MLENYYIIAVIDFPSIIFVFFVEFLRLKASETEEKNKVKELEDTQV